MKYKHWKWGGGIWFCSFTKKKRNSQETVWMKLIYSIEAKSQNGVDSIK